MNDILLDTTIDTKIQVFFHIDPAALRRWVPSPWEVYPQQAGPSQGSNFAVIFNDVLLKQDAEGRPAPDATNRFIGFHVYSRHSDTKVPCSFITRILTANAAAVPGRYRNSVHADVIREHRVSGDGLGSTVFEEFGARQREAGGKVDLRLTYERGMFMRLKSEWTVRSSIDPVEKQHEHKD